MTSTPDQIKGAILTSLDDYADAVAAGRVAAQKATDDQALATVQAEFDAYKKAHPADPKKPDYPPTSSKVLIGMSAPASQWDARLAEVGGTVYARRMFDDLATADNILRLAASEVKLGRYPIVSFKLPNNDWAGAAAGKYDAQIQAVVDKLAALAGRSFLTIHHEPMGNGTPADFAAMQRHVLPIVTKPANVDGGVIVNGFWWSSGKQGLSDTEIAAWLPKDVLALCDVVASDCYQGGSATSPGEYAAVKAANMAKWATRVGVTRLGIGEYNGHDGAAIKALGDLVMADQRFVFASVFNSDRDKSWVLTGDRLDAFKATLAASATR